MLMVDCDFPGGNIVVDSIEGDVISVHQDLRDTEGDWFYWYFSVRGAAGRTITVRFTQSNVIGVRGPGVSTDGGWTWSWLGAEAVDGQSFDYTVPSSVDDVRFSFGMPYLQRNLAAFLAQHVDSPYLRAEALCLTNKGRLAEKLLVGKLDGEPDYRILLTSRHHCCEMMATIAMEGILATVLGDTELGAWFREHVQFFAVPFVDKDGVEDGDQGKNRRPHDHNRDYNGDTPAGSIHPTIRAIREQVPAWAQGRLDIALDMHCPHIRGPHNEEIYFPGGSDQENWAKVIRFSELIQRELRGPLPYDPANNLPFGQAWNVPSNSSQGNSFGRWAQSEDYIGMGGSIEIAYANASGAEVNQETARLFGQDLARALKAYLVEEVK